MKELKQLYEDYVTEYQKASASKKLGEGLLGFGRSLSDDPCHERFAQRLEAYCALRFSRELPGQEAEALLRYMVEVPERFHSAQHLYWMLLAVQGFALPLVDRLTPEAAAVLAKEYAAKHPSWERLEPQQKLLSALQTRSGQTPKRRGLLSRFHRES